MIDTEELERRMRPGAWSHEGFLGPYERLEDVLRADRQTLDELGLTTDQLADSLERFLREAMDQIVESFERRAQEAKAEPSKATDDLGWMFRVNDRYELGVSMWMGFQDCPWSPERGHSCGHGSMDYEIRDLQRGLKLKCPQLITHLIRDHGFFEGFESPYRVDPRALAELLQLGPFAEPT